MLSCGVEKAGTLRTTEKTDLVVPQVVQLGKYCVLCTGCAYIVNALVQNLPFSMGLE